jgi:hypothetical protein
MSATYTAFLRDRRIASGSLTAVLGAIAGEPAWRQAQVFDDATGELIKLGRPEETARAAAPEGPSELRLSLLPRHLDWLQAQSGGPSAAVRRLIDAARREGVGRDRQARDAAYRFLSMMVGDRAGFEEACRALYAGDADRFDAVSRGWPVDVSRYARRLAADGWAQVIRPPVPAL